MTVLSQTDPTANPRGVAAAPTQSSPRAVTLKAGTPVAVALLNYLYTKEVQKGTTEMDVLLEVVEDVQVDGVVVIRKGALAKGKISGLTKSKTYGRKAAFTFAVESATAVDGQEVLLASDTVQRKGTSTAGVAATLAMNGVVGGLFAKGEEGLVRAGTLWDLPTAKESTIQVGQ